tara:strand:- start:33059 stop:33982 length:924 start_codon:yes stop_codon:yes gene_type:complete
MTGINSLWVEKYRPTTLEEIVVSPAVRAQFTKYREDKAIPHLLFVGTPGVGKTTAGKVIVGDILGCQMLYINASDEKGIDTIRSKVSSFASTLSFGDGHKVVMLDEADGLSPDAQRALRNTMEEFSAHTRFILTANYGHKIIPALKSRCIDIDMVPPIKEIVKRLLLILKAEEITVTDAEVKKLASNVKMMYPDMRKMINHIQQCSVTGELVLLDTKVSQATVACVYELICEDNPLDARKFIIKNEMSFGGDYPSLLRELLRYYYDNCTTNAKIRNAAIIIADHLYQSAFCMDQEINFTAAVVKLCD